MKLFNFQCTPPFCWFFPVPSKIFSSNWRPQSQTTWPNETSETQTENKDFHVRSEILTVISQNMTFLEALRHFIGTFRIHLQDNEWWVGPLMMEATGTSETCGRLHGVATQNKTILQSFQHPRWWLAKYKTTTLVFQAKEWTAWDASFLLVTSSSLTDFFLIGSVKS